VTTDIGPLLTTLRVEELDTNLFRGRTPQTEGTHLFGGHIIGQALAAVQQTVPEDRPFHSAHAYFMLAGDPSIPIVYDVEVTRDGGTFTTRRVTATQRGKAIFILAASFHVSEEGFAHQDPFPGAPPPDGLPGLTGAVGGAFGMLTGEWSDLDVRWGGPPLDKNMTVGPGAPPDNRLWLRTVDRMPDDPAVHASVLGYASDFLLLTASLMPHERMMWSPDLMVTSLDHAIWFHRPFRVDDWLLYASHSSSADAARGLVLGGLYTQDGVLVASTAQEGLLRRRKRPQQ
jgi:acyl-CoA thioesterase-2